MAVVYTHIRKDNNEVFYVGVGKHKSRAFDKRQRNKHWYHIVNKHGYNVNITHCDLCIEEAFCIEKYLISFYGRKDLKSGTLVNMTDGGDGTVNKSKESIYKQLETAKINGTYDDMCNRMRYYSSIQDKCGVNSLVRKDAYVYDLSGKYIAHYPTYTLLAKDINSSAAAISKRVNTGKQIKKHFVYNDFKGESLDNTEYVITNLSERGRGNVVKKGISLYDKFTGAIVDFETYHDASLFVGRNRGYISRLVGINRLEFDNYKIILN